MNNYKLHTPEGTVDCLPMEYSAKRKIQSKFTKIFETYGYQMLQTPGFEYVDVYAQSSPQETMIKFFDGQGRVLALRSDFTPAIARIAATKYQDAAYPLRLCYNGVAYRNNESYSNLKQKEFTQAGVELIGVSKPEADAEVIAMTIQCLKDVGLQEFQIDLGQAAFLKGLCLEAGLTEEEEQALRAVIDRKDFLGIEHFLQTHEMHENVKEIISKIPSLFGDISIIQELENIPLNDISKGALENLRTVYGLLQDYGVEDFISIDLGMMSGFDYYTGIIFKGFTHNVGFPICGGGRYDHFISQFGLDVPATGVAIWVERVLSALSRSGGEYKQCASDCLIEYPKKYFKTALTMAEALRIQGLKVELHIGDLPAEEYARKAGIGGIFRVLGESRVESVNLLTGEVKQADIAALCEEVVEK